MRAGLSSNSRTTASRSPARFAGERSMIRYCIGLPSGTRRLAEEVLDQFYGVLVRPITLAVNRVANAALRVDHEGHRQAAHLPILRRILLRIEEDRQREALALDEGRDLVAEFAIVHREHLERAPREPIAQPLQGGHL